MAKPSLSDLLSAPSLLKAATQADATRVGETPGVKGKHLRDSYRDWRKANWEQQKADFDFDAISKLPKKEKEKALLRTASYFLGANVAPRAVGAKIMDVSKIDPARIIGSPTSAIAKVPLQKGAYQSALARLAPPDGGGAASSSAIRALIETSFEDSFNKAEASYENFINNGGYSAAPEPRPQQAPEPSDRWFHPRWNPNETALGARERAYIIYPDPPDKPSTQMSANPSGHSRRFVTMTGSGKEYDIDKVLADVGWRDWVTKHTKPIGRSEYYDGLNSDEFIDKLNENIAKLNKSKTSYAVQKSLNSDKATWIPSITATYPDGSRSIGYPYFDLTPGAVDIPTGLEGLPEHFKVASYFDTSYPGLNAVNTMMGGILNPSETGGGTHFYEALAKTLRETGKGNLRDGRNSKSEHSFALWENIKPDKGFSFRREPYDDLGGGFNSVFPLIPGLLGLMGQKEERDGSSNK